MVDRTEYEIDHVIAEGMESLLADVIRKYPVLYDKTYRYTASFQEKSEIAWNKISDELNLELNSCKSLWSCMKQKFIKHRKRLDNGDTTSPWPTYNKLHQWLDRHVKKRKSRNDYIKQVKNIPKTTTSKKRNSTNNIDDDDTNEEWTDGPIILDDKDTTVQIQLKRKSDIDPIDTANGSVSSGGRNDSKKKFNIEVISESGTTIFNDTELFSDTEQKAAIHDPSVVILEKNEQSQIEVIEVKDTTKSEVEDAVKDYDFNKFFNKIEQFMLNFSHLNERYNNMEPTKGDSNDAFGKYIASMIRELPSDKHMKIRLNILQYATELISNEAHRAK